MSIRSIVVAATGLAALATLTVAPAAAGHFGTGDRALLSQYKVKISLSDARKNLTGPCYICRYTPPPLVNKSPGPELH